MKKVFGDVCFFEVASGRGIPAGGPGVTSVKDVEFVIRLIEEEHRETIAALNVVKDAMLLGEPVRVDMIADIADGFADSIWVNAAGAVRLAVDLPAVWEEVNKANRAKFAPGWFIDEQMKTRKPAGWKPPDIERVILSQGSIASTYGEPS